MCFDVTLTFDYFVVAFHLRIVIFTLPILALGHAYKVTDVNLLLFDTLVDRFIRLFIFLDCPVVVPK